MNDGVSEGRVSGLLLGVALGDALGLPFEGLSARRVASRIETLDRHHFLGARGFVSDDTEQSALLAHALLAEPVNAERCASAFRRSMRGWFARLPFGIGLATLRACLRMLFGLRRSGVRSAGNGAAMRASVVGAFLPHEPGARRRFGRALAMVTHTDDRAIEGALYVAEMTAAILSASAGIDRRLLVRRSRVVVENPELAHALNRASRLARTDISLADAATELGTTGFVVHSIGLTTFCFLKYGASPMRAIQAAVLAGGDTDSNAAIVGGWVGALHGARALPRDLVDKIHDGPFGPTHLRALARALAGRASVPTWSWARAMLRNVALYPVVLAHGAARLVPW